MDLRDNHVLGALKDGFRQQEIGIGTLVRSFVDDTKPPKYKYWLIVGRDTYDWAVIYLNSNISPFASKNQEISDLQVQITCDHRKLVEYDCYADCAQIKTKKIAVIQPQLEANPALVRGVFSSEEMTLILEKIRGSRIIASKLKQRFNI